MHSLEQITKINRDAFHDHIHNARARGLYVVSVMEGLHVYTFTAHAEAADAERRKQAEDLVHRSTGRTCEVLAPLHIAEPQRAEDRDADARQLKLFD